MKKELAEKIVEIANRPGNNEYTKNGSVKLETFSSYLKTYPAVSGLLATDVIRLILSNLEDFIDDFGYSIYDGKPIESGFILKSPSELTPRQHIAAGLPYSELKKIPVIY
jgi:hypothetical protein